MPVLFHNEFFHQHVLIYMLFFKFVVCLRLRKVRLYCYGLKSEEKNIPVSCNIMRTLAFVREWQTCNPKVIFVDE